MLQPGHTEKGNGLRGGPSMPLPVALRSQPAGPWGKAHKNSPGTGFCVATICDSAHPLRYAWSMSEQHWPFWFFLGWLGSSASPLPPSALHVAAALLTTRTVFAMTDLQVFGISTPSPLGGHPASINIPGLRVLPSWLCLAGSPLRGRLSPWCLSWGWIGVLTRGAVCSWSPAGVGRPAGARAVRLQTCQAPPVSSSRSVPQPPSQASVPSLTGVSALILVRTTSLRLCPLLQIAFPSPGNQGRNEQPARARQTGLGAHRLRSEPSLPSKRKD